MELLFEVEEVNLKDFSKKEKAIMLLRLCKDWKQFARNSDNLEEINKYYALADNCWLAAYKLGLHDKIYYLSAYPQYSANIRQDDYFQKGGDEFYDLIAMKLDHRFEVISVPSITSKFLAKILVTNGSEVEYMERSGSYEEDDDIPDLPNESDLLAHTYFCLLEIDENNIWNIPNKSFIKEYLSIEKEILDKILPFDTEIDSYGLYEHLNFKFKASEAFKGLWRKSC